MLPWKIRFDQGQNKTVYEFFSLSKEKKIQE